VPLKDEKACTVADAVIKQWVGLFGLPEKLLSDQGHIFEGEVVRRMCVKLGTKKISTSPYHP
jgi:hypothetical protein